MGTVINSNCQVYDVDSLRVVDASIFPFPLAAHYQAAVYAVVEQVRMHHFQKEIADDSKLLKLSPRRILGRSN